MTEQPPSVNHPALRHLSLRQWRYALAAAERSHVTAAAAALNVSQPAISAAIAELEAHYGRALFVRRKGQGISPTPFGRRLFARARNLLAEAADLAGIGLTGEEESETVGGDVVLACHHDLAPFYLPRLLTEIHARHPAVTLRFREGDFDSIARAMEENSIDLALSYDVAFDHSLDITELGALRLTALLPAVHPLAARKTVKLRDLAMEPFIMNEQPHTWQHVMDLFALHGLPSPRIAARVSGFELQRGLVANGHGVTIAYTRPVGDRSYDGTDIAVRPIGDAVPPQKILLVRHPASPPSRACDAVMRCAIDWFRRDHGADRGVNGGTSRARKKA